MPRIKKLVLRDPVGVPSSCCTIASERIDPWRRIRRSRAPSSGPGTFFAAQFSAGCTTNISGFDLRQAQAAELYTRSEDRLTIFRIVADHVRFWPPPVAGIHHKIVPWNPSTLDRRCLVPKTKAKLLIGSRRSRTLSYLQKEGGQRSEHKMGFFSALFGISKMNTDPAQHHLARMFV